MFLIVPSVQRVVTQQEETAQTQAEMEENLLIEREEYLAAGVHIGTKSTHVDMEPFIFRVKKNKLAVLDLEQTDERIRDAAEFIAQFEPEDVLVVGRKEAAYDPIELFTEYTGAEHIIGRFTPGTLTNPRAEKFREPEVVIVTDPEQDSQVVKEAAQTNVPVVAFCDSGDTLENIGHPIPANNKGEKAIATVYYLLARQILEERGVEADIDIEEWQPEEEEE